MRRLLAVGIAALSFALPQTGLAQKNVAGATESRLALERLQVPARVLMIGHIRTTKTRHCWHGSLADGTFGLRTCHSPAAKADKTSLGQSRENCWA